MWGGADGASGRGTDVTPRLIGLDASAARSEGRLALPLHRALAWAGLILASALLAAVRPVPARLFPTARPW